MSNARRKKVPIHIPILVVGVFLLLFGGLGFAMCSDVLWYTEQGERMDQVVERDYGGLRRDLGFRHTAIADDEAKLEGTIDGFEVTVQLHESGRYRGERLRREVTLRLESPLEVPAGGEVQIIGIEVDPASVVASVDDKTVVKAGGEALAQRLSPALKEQLGRLLIRFPGTLSLQRDQLVWTSTWTDFKEPLDGLVRALPELARALSAP